MLLRCCIEFICYFLFLWERYFLILNYYVSYYIILMTLTLQKVKDTIKKEIDKLNLFKGQFYTTFKDSKAITQQNQKQFEQKLKSLSNALSQKEQSLILKLILVKQWLSSGIKMGKDCTGTEIQNQYQTVILKTCDKYHPFTLKQLLLWKCDKEQYFCPYCKKGTQNTNDIIPDALSQIYFRFGNHTNVQLLINKKQMTPPNVSDEIQQRQKQLQLQHNILTTLISFSSHYYQITLRFLKCEDDSMLDKMKQQYDLLMLKDDHKQYKDKIKSENYHVNLISTNTNKYILHPVFHKECLPQNHSKKLIAFNLQEILAAINKGKSMKCPYPSCQNQFKTIDDLRKKGIIMPVFQEKIFKREKYFMFGIFEQQKEFQFINQRIQARFKLEYELDLAKKSDQDTFKNSVLMLQNYFSTKKNKFQDYVQKYQQTFEGENYIKFQLAQNESNHYSDNSFLYVICNNCLKDQIKNINKSKPIKIRQYIKFIFSNCRAKKIKCPDCLTDITHDKLSDTFLPDFNFSFFAYFQNRIPNGIYIYDIKKKSYLNNISNASPEQIKITLLNQKRQNVAQNTAKQDKVNLKKKQLENFKPIVFIHDKCRDKEQALLFIYKRNQKMQVKMFNKLSSYNNIQTVTAQDIESKKGLNCPICSEQLQINDLIYERKLTQKNFPIDPQLPPNISELKITQSQDSLFSADFKYGSIQQTVTLDFIKGSYLFCGEYGFEDTNFVVFSRCKHAPNTRICHFNDIKRAQRKCLNLGIKPFMQCRFKFCNQIYTKNSQIKKVNLKIEPDQLKKIKSLKSQWLKYQYSWKIPIEKQLNQIKQYQEIFRISVNKLLPEKVKQWNQTDKEAMQKQVNQRKQDIINNFKKEVKNVRHMGGIFVFQQGQVPASTNALIVSKP